MASLILERRVDDVDKTLSKHNVHRVCNYDVGVCKRQWALLSSRRVDEEKTHNGHW
jgi:hypothetical protein